MPIYQNQYPEYFHDNKFTNAYFFIINKSQTQNRKKLARTSPNFIYYEKHHILPRALNGSDDENNLVNVTAYEHFLLHYFLIKMCKITKYKTRMTHSFRLMITERRTNSIKNPHHIKNMGMIYDSIKQDLSHVSSITNKGRKMPETYCKLMSERMSGNGNPMYGRMHGDKTIEKMAAVKKGNKYSCKTYSIILPSKETIIVTGKRDWCNTRDDISVFCFDQAVKNNVPYKGYYITEIKKENSKGRPARRSIKDREERIKQEELNIAKRLEHKTTRSFWKLKKDTPKEIKRSSSNYCITNPAGETVFIDDAPRYCREHNLIYYKFRHAAKTRTLYNGLNIELLNPKKKEGFNKSQNNYQIIHPCGKLETINGCQKFCKENNISVDAFKYTLSRCKPHKGFLITLLPKEA